MSVDPKFYAVLLILSERLFRVPGWNVSYSICIVLFILPMHTCFMSPFLWALLLAAKEWITTVQNAHASTFLPSPFSTRNLKMELLFPFHDSPLLELIAISIQLLLCI